MRLRLFGPRRRHRLRALPRGHFLIGHGQHLRLVPCRPRVGFDRRRRLRRLPCLPRGHLLNGRRRRLRFMLRRQRAGNDSLPSTANLTTNSDHRHNPLPFLAVSRPHHLRSLRRWEFYPRFWGHCLLVLPLGHFRRRRGCHRLRPLPRWHDRRNDGRIGLLELPLGPLSGYRL